MMRESFKNEKNDNVSTASHGERMDKDKKILPKNFLNDTFESGDLMDMSNKELKNMVSSILSEDLTRRSKLPKVRKP